MSYPYDQYLVNHKTNVKKGFEWIRDNLPDLLRDGYDYEHQIYTHDQSKTEQDEYDAYDAYFYGGNKSFAVVQEFEKAFLRHLHRNPHHWQHWILVSYDDTKKQKVFEMPHNYILEMICDWWAFSWDKGDLAGIFAWYDEHKDAIQFHEHTRKVVEDILSQIKAKLEEQDDQ